MSKSISGPAPSLYKYKIAKPSHLLASSPAGQARPGLHPRSTATLKVRPRAPSPPAGPGL